jgi:hypothetical protein
VDVRTRERLDATGTCLEVQNPPRWYRFLDRMFERNSNKQFNDRLERIKAAAEGQASTAG